MLKLFGPDNPKHIPIASAKQYKRSLELYDPSSYIPKSADQVKRFLELFGPDDLPYIPKNGKWKYPRKINF